MSKIYIVADGDYSDYRIIGASTSRESAERIQKAFKACYLHELDDAVAISSDLSPFQVKISDLGVVHSVTLAKNAYEMRAAFDGGGNMRTGIWARDVEHAVKIANERRVQVKALNAWDDEDRLAEFPWSEQGPQL